MEIPWPLVILYVAPFVGFTRQTIQFEGKLSLSMNKESTAYMVEFLIVLLAVKLQAKIANCDLSIEVSDENNIHVIYGDHKATQ